MMGARRTEESRTSFSLISSAVSAAVDHEIPIAAIAAEPYDVLETIPGQGQTVSYPVPALPRVHDLVKQPCRLPVTRPAC